MGSGGADYSNQINESLRQANTPKSALANSVSGFVQGSFPSAFAGLLNGGSLGNSFPGYSGGANSPGMVFNRNPLGYAGSIGTQDPNAPPPVPGGNDPNYPTGIYDSPNRMPNQNQFAGMQAFSPVQAQQKAFSGNTADYSMLPATATPGTQNGYNINAPAYQGQLPTQAALVGMDQAGRQGVEQGIYDQYSKYLNGNAQNYGYNPEASMPSDVYGIYKFLQSGGQGFDPNVGGVTPGQQGGSTFPNANMSYFGGGSTFPVTPPGPIDHNPESQPENPVSPGNTLVQPPAQGRDTNPNTAPQQNFPTFPYDPTGQLYQNNPSVQYPSGSGGLGSIQPIQTANPQFAGLNMGGQNQQALATLMQQFQAPQNNLIPQGGGQLSLNQPTGMDTDYYNALSQNLNNQLNVGSKNLQAQFGATGGSSRGTPAAYAQAQYQAMALPQLAAALGQARQGEAANQLAGQANQNNALLGASNINANAALGTNQLNSQNAGNVLNNQLGFQTNQNQANLGQNSLQSLLSQFNTGQQNSLAQQYAQMQQSANESQIGRQFTGLQNFSQIAAALAGAGIPGGSANVNLGGQSQSDMSQLTQLISALGGLG